MTVVELRNTLAAGLSTALGIPVVLADQTAPASPLPCAYYNITAPYIPYSPFGDHFRRVQGEDVEDIRREHAAATLSYTFCSASRWEGDAYIHGDDEAHALCDRAIAWLRHTAYNDLSNQGIVILDVMNTGDRSTLDVDEAARRYGFDLRVGYVRTDSRLDPAVNTVTYYPTKE